MIIPTQNKSQGQRLIIMLGKYEINKASCDKFKSTELMKNIFRSKTAKVANYVNNSV